MSQDYLSDVLFHFWGKNLDEDKQFQIFEDITRNGLLLTCGNKDFIDEFKYYSYSSKRIDKVRLLQWARVCFTEVPSDKLQIIKENFGGFGLGFKRDVILRWGGCPVWYLPNYFEENTQYGKIPSCMNNLRELVDLLQDMRRKPVILSRGGRNLLQQASGGLYENFIGTLYFLFSHFKEMSTKRSDDHFFLYEREWRIVFGLHYGPPVSPSVFKQLTVEQKRQLVSNRSDWGHPPRTGIEYIDQKLPIKSLVDSFRWFNGIPGMDTITSEIEKIFVPSDNLKLKVEGYLAGNTYLFPNGFPPVEVLRL